MNITRSFVSERDRALLSGDYAAYHAQATRRLHALRKRLGNTTPKGKKYAPKAAVTAENVASNVEWIQLLLASAERAWADAMAMKQAQSPENTQKPLPGSTKKQIVSRLRRAILHAKNLVDILKDGNAAKANPIDLLEAKAYLAMLKGSRDFEKSRWQPCIQSYALTRIIYTTLSDKIASDVYKELLSGIVDPTIRYAAYQMKMPRTKPLPEIVVENFPSAESGTRKALTDLDTRAFETQKDSALSTDGAMETPTHIAWRSRKVKLEDAAISQAVGLAQQNERMLDESYVSFQSGKIDDSAFATAYESIITARQDAVDATKNAIDELTAEGVDPGDSRMQSLQITRTALNYAVIEHRIGRSRVLCGPEDGLNFERTSRKTSSQPGKDSNARSAKLERTGHRLSRLRERVALYDSILQSLDSVKELPGVVADQGLMKELDGKRAYFRALKCLAVGRSHAINGNTTNALALYSRALSLAQTAQATLSNAQTPSSVPKLDVTSSSLDSAAAYLSKLVTQYRGLADLKFLSATPASNSSVPQSALQRPMIEVLHLNQYQETVDLTNLVNYPPRLRPIPVKPLFFDIAWNYIQYPGHGKKEALSNGPSKSGEEIKREGTPSQEEKPAAKKGWFGFGRS